MSARRPCGLARSGGAWIRVVPCRLEDSGLVVDAPGHTLRPGEEVRLRLQGGAAAHHFEATVLRVGVAVPERGPDGLLLGFLAPLEAAAVAGGAEVEVVLAGGTSLSLLADPVRLLGVDARGLDLEIPTGFTVSFPVRGGLHLRLGASGDRVEATARVAVAQRGDTSVHYRLQVEQVADRAAYLRVVDALRASLAL